ncbi:hypothetical protein [Saccharothrix luteola]|uniref:hypothetical protein n=1 Tax=Saccharothrix luteola TaxID=2893018 RepID=UPI001E626FCC|nr:hypothetical protein [Saccharothrix luteola]MCC8245557.1 hypothetical protein [Saccharothrix luteola]
MRVRNRSVVVAVMAAAMAFGAVSPALALDQESDGHGVVSEAGADLAGDAEMGTQDRKWYIFPWW